MGDLAALLNGQSLANPGSRHLGFLAGGVCRILKEANMKNQSRPTWGQFCELLGIQ